MHCNGTGLTEAVEFEGASANGFYLPPAANDQKINVHKFITYGRYLEEDAKFWAIL